MWSVRNLFILIALSLLACTKHIEGGTEEEVLFSKMPRRAIANLQNVRLSVVAEHWHFADPSDDALRDLDREIRARVGGPRFWKKASAPNIDGEPEMVVMLSAARIGQERTIMFYHAFLVETVSLANQAEKVRAVTWYGQPWYGSSYPAALAGVVHDGKEFILADMERNTR